mgnify:CR=1 FL=1
MTFKLNISKILVQDHKHDIFFKSARRDKYPKIFCGFLEHFPKSSIFRNLKFLVIFRTLKISERHFLINLGSQRLFSASFRRIIYNFRQLKCGKFEDLKKHLTFKLNNLKILVKDHEQVEIYISKFIVDF